MKLELKKLVLAYGCLTGMAWVITPEVMAQDDPGAHSNDTVCIDEDGDGWGWDGSGSCQVPGFVPMAGACVDYDGDGYGWNGVASCIVTEASCVDEDGDGWGWNGQASCLVDDFVPVVGACVDSDGDGYGWNGVASCMADGSDPGGNDGSGFGEMLEGVRSYGCFPGDEEFYTTEYVEVFANGITTNDIWLYEGLDCTSRPLTFTTALSLLSYELEGELTASDGTPVYGIKYDVLQLSSEEGEDAFPVGTSLYDIVALQDGGVSVGADFATTPEERSLDLLTFGPAQPVGMRTDTATAEALMHPWKAQCYKGRIHQRVFDEQNLTETVQYFDDNNCSVNRYYATLINTWDVTYGEAVTTVFGQSVLRVRSELADSRLLNIVIGSGLPAPPSLSEVGKVFEDIWGVYANELVIGTCLDKRPDDGCGTLENIPDILNFNIGNRFERQ